MKTPDLRVHAVLAMLVALLASCSPSRPPVMPTAESHARLGAASVARGDMKDAIARFEAAIEQGDDPQAAALARDSLREIYGTRLYPDVVTDCPRAAQDALHAAEEQFGAGKFDAALPLYRTAADGCPRSAVIRVAMADAHYARGDYETAREEFRAAIAIDPWNRAAHRYLGDTEEKLGNRYAAWEEAMLAVLSDPQYEMAWIALASRTDGGPARLRRVRADKPSVTKAKGGPIDISLDASGPTSAAARADQADWMSYSLAAAVHSDNGKSMLDNERARVASVLDMRGQAVSSAANPGFWDLMAEASMAGYLDEAIFVMMIDPSMAGEYAEFRNAKRQRLVEYMKKMVSPPPTPARPGAVAAAGRCGFRPISTAAEARNRCSWRGEGLWFLPDERFAAQGAVRVLEHGFHLDVSCAAMEGRVGRKMGRDAGAGAPHGGIREA